MTHHERRLATHANLDRLNADELEAVAYLIDKLLAGAKKHGPLQLATDARDWPSEMMEEYADALFYAAFASVQRARRTAPVADLAGLAARDQFLDPDPDITSDAWWQRHPLGSPARVQAVEEHRAACVEVMLPERSPLHGGRIK